MSLDEIRYYCKACKLWQTVSPEKASHCPHCNARTLAVPRDYFEKNTELKQCPMCNCTHLYQQKDFNRKLGVALVAVASLAAFYTYGISLVALAVVDWFVFRRVPLVGLCYRCHAQFRGKVAALLPAFELGLHDYYKNLQSKATQHLDAPLN